MKLKINGEPVEEQRIRDEMERLRPQYEQTFSDMPEAEREQQLFDWSKENVIERILLAQKARESQYSVTKAEIDARFEEVRSGQNVPQDEYENLRMDIELELRLKKLLDEVTAHLEEPSDSEMRTYFEQNRKLFRIPEQVRAAHIVKYINSGQSRAQAYQEILKIQEKLKAGQPFETLADQLSDCPGNGGDLGWFTRGQMVQEFEDAVFALQSNQVSELILSEYGYHIAKLYQREPERPVPFDEVKPQIFEYLLNEKKDKCIESYLDGLKKEATILEED